MPWDYDAKPDFTSQIWSPSPRPASRRGWLPGVNNWNRLYPNNNEALGNIRAFVRDGQKLGATGMLNTVWNDDGEGLFDENWFGVLFGAAAAWQPGESSKRPTFTRFVWARISRRSRPARSARRKGIDGRARAVQERRSRRCAGRLLSGSILSRRRASGWLQSSGRFSKTCACTRRARITLLAEARDAARNEHRELANPEALDALELGARRIDFVGLKFQNVDEIA